MHKLNILNVLIHIIANSQPGKLDGPFSEKGWAKQVYFQSNILNENAATVLPQSDGGMLVVTATMYVAATY